MSRYTFDRPAPSPDLIAENQRLVDKNVRLCAELVRLRTALVDAGRHEASLRALAEALRPYLSIDDEF